MKVIPISENEYQSWLKEKAEYDKAHSIKIQIGEGKIETSDTVTIETPDGKKVMIFEDLGKWIILVL